MTPCILCSSAPVKALWRCEACYRFLLRKGSDRPPKLLDRALQREMAKTR